MRAKRLMLFLMLSGILLNWNRPLKACGWSEEDYGSFYTFFHPTVYHFGNLQAFHWTYDRLYDYQLLDDSTSQDDNLQAWMAYLGKPEYKNDLNWLIYKASLEEAKAVHGFVKGEHPIPYQCKQMPLMPWLKSAGKSAVTAYIIAAKEAEPFCAYWDEWGTGEKPDSLDASGLAGTMFQAMQKESDPVLKVRYGYQGLRLLHRIGNYQGCVMAYEQYVAATHDPKNLLSWWALSEYAGALKRINRQADASYHFSRVFENCPSRRIQAWYGWNITDQENWNALMASCKNNQERTVNHFLRCINPEAIAMEDFKAICKLSPESEYARLVALREINKLEKSVLGYAFEHDSPFYERLKLPAKEQNYDSYSAEQRTAFLSTLAEMAADRKSQEYGFWNLTYAYAQFLSGKVQTAMKHLDMVVPHLSPKDKVRMEMLQIVMDVCMVQQIDQATEDKLLLRVENMESRLWQEDFTDLINLLNESLSLIYYKQGQLTKSLLARGYSDYFWDRGTLEQVDDFLVFHGKAGKSKYENYLLSRSPSKESILELKATRLLALDRFDEAIAILKDITSQNPEGENTFLNDDPFLGKLRDHINCYDRYCADKKYTKRTFAERVQELRKRTITETQSLGKIYAELGHAFYNTTYFGPAWNATDYYRREQYSNLPWERSDENYSNPVDDARDRLYMNIASEYYKLAMKNAKTKEEAAEACFHLAKAQQNLQYLDGVWEWQMQERPAFQTLMDNYQGTKFYNRAVRECKYFYFYVNR